MRDIIRIPIFLCLWLTTMMQASAERARDIIGSLTVQVIYASHSPIKSSVGKTTPLPADFRERLIKDPKLRFEHYALIGEEKKPLFRSVENWSQPIATSDDILVRFEPQARPSKELTRLDVEIWLSRRKSLKVGVALSATTPLFIVGPEWKDGNMILAIMLEPYQTPIKASEK
jgi:hypothetical protein